jgi:hypothetical protein
METSRLDSLSAINSLVGLCLLDGINNNRGVRRLLFTNSAQRALNDVYSAGQCGGTLAHGDDQFIAAD